MSKTPTPAIQDRIKELRRVPASDLIPHPLNWRLHPKAQSDALSGVLSEIGFADAVIARETPEGLQLIDGHLRQNLMGDELIPVLVVDLTEDEAAKMLITLDPLAAMAEPDQSTLEILLAGMSFDNEAITAMLVDLADFIVPDFQPSGVDDQSRLDEKKLVQCPECGHEF